MCSGEGSNRSFRKQFHSRIIHLWEAHSMASSLFGKFRDVSSQLRDEVVDPRCLDLPLALASLWRPLRFQINVQFGRVRVPPAASGCGDGIIILQKLLTTRSWKLWPRWKGKSLQPCKHVLMPLKDWPVFNLFLTLFSFKICFGFLWQKLGVQHRGTCLCVLLNETSNKRNEEGVIM